LHVEDEKGNNKTYFYKGFSNKRGFTVARIKKYGDRGK
jgi:hypothetical protein